MLESYRQPRTKQVRRATQEKFFDLKNKEASLLTGSR